MLLLYVVCLVPFPRAGPQSSFTRGGVQPLACLLTSSWLRAQEERDQISSTQRQDLPAEWQGLLSIVWS